MIQCADNSARPRAKDIRQTLWPRRHHLPLALLLPLLLLPLLLRNFGERVGRGRPERRAGQAGARTLIDVIQEAFRAAGDHVGEVGRLLGEPRDG